MKKKFTLLAAALAASMAISVSAEPVKVGNLWYEILDADAKTAEIVAPPTGTPYANVQNGWFAKSVTIDGETYTVETVGEGAFEGASFSPYANSSGVATFYMIAVPMKVIKKDAFKDITTRSDGNVGIRFTTNVCTGNVTGSSILTSVEPGAFRGAHIRGFVATGGSGGYSHTAAFSNGATGLYNTSTNTIISAPADMRADASMGSNGAYGGYATTVTFNSAALEVADYAFWGNARIKTMNMNEGLTTIGQQAFYGMTALQTVNIPSTVTTLATDAFEGCTAISNLTCSTTTPPAGVVFEDAVYERIRESGNITVPAEALDAYKADPNWKKFWFAPVAAPKMYIAGTFTNWADGKLEMTENDGVYTITVNGITDGAEFKFIEGDENPVWYGGNSSTSPYYVHEDWCTDIDLIVEGGVNFAVVGGGDLTFTISADKKLTVTGWPLPANELYLAGSMTNWATDKEAMTLNAETGKFSITKEMAAGAEF
ncbi:MAG: leucine-rich repeat protein, partial [Muribaculaceae bacterium]|nr:leucine-rich repeat protein [Muribaculaceae bacterium]